jgi:hypothetical protein
MPWLNKVWPGRWKRRKHAPQLACRRERLVDVAGEAGERHLRFVLAPNDTPASIILSQQAAAAAGIGNLASPRDSARLPAWARSPQLAICFTRHCSVCCDASARWV